MKQYKGNPLYNMMRMKLNVNRNKMFLLNGIVVSLDIKLDYTVLEILVLDYLKDVNNEEMYQVYAFNEAKRFTDEYIREGNVVDITGEITISKKVEKLGQIVLLARYIHNFGIDLDGYDTEDIPDYISPDDLTDEDLAY